MADNVFSAPYTVQITTGDWTTVNDKFDATQPNNFAKNVLGTKIYVIDSTGRIKILRYVRYNSAVNPAAPAAPAPVYWTDNGHTTVSGRSQEGFTGLVSSVAGYLVNLAFTNGNFIFIQTGGFLPAAVAPAAGVADDWNIGAAGNFTPARIASGTAPTNVVLAIALGANVGNKADVFVEIDT